MENKTSNQSTLDFDKSKMVSTFWKGLLMGTADIIPGISGGTVALITGIYDQLLKSITAFNLKLVKLLTNKKWIDALQYINITFLIPLVLGILIAIMSTARLMHFLMDNYSIQTWSLFFGLMAGSIITLFKEVPHIKSFKGITQLILGTTFAYIIVGLVPVKTPEEFWFIFLCGAIGITAMILPGISGSFIMLIMGKYFYITYALKNPFILEHQKIILVFASGALVGLLVFSRVLHYFIESHRESTMTLLIGFMVGSMRKIWPFKNKMLITTGNQQFMKEENIFPPFDAIALTSFSIILLSFLFVIVIDHYKGSVKGKK